MKPWNVRRTWWELTKLVLTGKGSYEMNAFLDLVDEDTPETIQSRTWMPYHLDWQGGTDRYATLSFDVPEEH